jgi:hypothetical protein
MSIPEGAFGLNTHPGEAFRIQKPGLVEGTHVVEIHVKLFNKWCTHGTFSEAQLAKMRVELHGEETTIIIDQFRGPTPYELQRLEQMGTPYKWDEFLESIAKGTYDGGYPKHPIVTKVDDLHRLEMSTTAYRKDEKGNVSVWRARWDSSG